MTEILKIELNENQEPIISGRQLHEVLEVKTKYKDWFPRMLEYGFIENTDFIAMAQKRATAQGNETTFIDHAIKLDMAKEIAMLQRSEKGKEVRQYFINIEKEYNSPEKIMARALNIANKQLKNLALVNKEQEQVIQELKPKALFATAVESSKTSILIGDLAKILKQNGVETGQKRLFDWLRVKGYLIKGGSSKNMPTQKSMDLGLFEVKESTVNNPNGSIRINKTTKVTGKGQTYFINLFLGEKEAV